MNKWVSILIIVLIIAILSEVGYLFYQNRVAEMAKNLPEEEKIVASDTLPSVENINPENTASNDAKAQAISQKALDRLFELQALKKGVLKSALVDYQVEGEITTIVYPNQIGNFEDTPQITLKGANGYTNTFFFPENYSDVLKISDNKQNKINLSQLKKGDKITIRYMINVLKLGEEKSSKDSLEKIEIVRSY